MSSSIARIEASIGSIAAQKESLRRAFDSLKSHSPAFASFNLDWNDLESQIAAEEKSILDRFAELQAAQPHDPAPAPAAAAAAAADSPWRLELASLSANMDAKGLKRLLMDATDRKAVRLELTPALLSSPDPASLVLDAISDFSQGSLRTHTACVDILSALRDIVTLDIKPLVRERAKNLAKEWMWRIKDRRSGCSDRLKNIKVANELGTAGFLLLVASFRLASDFECGFILDLLTLLSSRKYAIDLCKDLVPVDRIPDLIRKLNDKTKQRDAIKFVYAFNLLDKFSPVHLLKSFLKESKKLAAEACRNGEYSSQAKKEELARKELVSLRSVLRVVDVYKLENEYPREELVRQICELEKHEVTGKNNPRRLKRLAEFRQRREAVKSNRLSQQPPHVHTQPQLMPILPAPYMGPAGGATVSSFNRADPRLGGVPVLYPHYPVLGRSSRYHNL